jgi:hypothetical protein
MAWAGAVMGIAGSALSIGGQVADGQAANAQASFSESHAREQARTVGNQAAARELSMRRETNQQLGAQSAAIAESGTGYGGSNKLIMDDSTTNAELAALWTRYEGKLAIQRYDEEAKALKPQPSSIQRMFGKRGLGRLSHFNWGNPSNWGSPGSGEGRGW